MFKFIVFFILLIVILCLFPYPSQSNNHDLFSDDEFLKIKPEIDKISSKINAYSFKKIESGSLDENTYNVVIRFGVQFNVKNLLGWSYYQSRSIKTYSLGTWMAREDNGLIYNEEKMEAYVTPYNIKSFYEWVASLAVSDKEIMRVHNGGVK